MKREGEGVNVIAPPEAPLLTALHADVHQYKTIQPGTKSQRVT